MKYKKLLIFLMAASLVPRTGSYTVFAAADAGIAVSASQESDSSAAESEAEDSTANPAESEVSGVTDTQGTENSEGESSSSESTSSEESGIGSESGDTISSGTEVPGGEESDPENSDAEQNSDAENTDGSGEENSELTAAPGENTEGTDSEAGAAEGTENGETAAETELPAEETPAEEVTAPAPEVTETTPEEIEQLQEEDQLEEEHDLTPEWHPEWQGRGAEFELHPFKLIFPVYVRTAKEVSVYDRKEESESRAVAKIGEGTYIRLIEGDIEEIERISEIAEEAEEPDEEILDEAMLEADAAGEEETEAEAQDEDAQDADALDDAGENGISDEEYPDEEILDEAMMDAETEEAAEEEAPDEEASDEQEPEEDLPPMWVYIEAMDADGNICRGYVDGNDLVAARSFDNDLSKVEILKDRDENEAFYDNYLTTYRALRDENPVSDERVALVNYGLQFLGNPYVWGGTSLTEGCDCSGFAGGVYRHFGYDLPRCSYEMCYVSEKMNPYEAQPGDLLFFANEERVCHVMICLSNEGDGTLYVVEAKGRKWGIVVSRVSCERVVWGISILDGQYKGKEKDFVSGKQLLQKPVKVTV